MWWFRVVRWEPLNKYLRGTAWGDVRLDRNGLHSLQGEKPSTVGAVRLSTSISPGPRYAGKSLSTRYGSHSRTGARAGSGGCGHWRARPAPSAIG
jgi:hypothetical protein